MRIAVASDDGEHVAAHTGRCRQYVVFEVTDGVATRCAALPYDHTAHAQGRCGEGARHHRQSSEGGGQECHQGVLAALANSGVLIAGGMGRRLTIGLVAAGVTPYLCRAGTVEEAAQAFLAGELVPLSPASACQH
jgi:predicted Fe-Mo cluster-binding NifX family protein